MQQLWWYRSGENCIGPIASQQLRRLATEGKISPQTQVRVEGSELWHPAGRLKGLFAQRPPQPPATTSCPACHSVTQADDAFCMHCGANLGSARSVSSSPLGGLCSLWIYADIRVIRIIRSILLALNIAILLILVLGLSMLSAQHPEMLTRDSNIYAVITVTATLILILMLALMTIAPVACSITYFAVTTMYHFYSVLGASNAVPGGSGAMWQGFLGALLSTIIVAALMWQVLRRGLRLRYFNA